MKCAMCFAKLIDVGDGYECKNCGYFLEYDEIDESEDEESTDEYEVYYYEYDNFIEFSEACDTYITNED